MTRTGRDSAQRVKLRRMVAARGAPCFRCGQEIDYTVKYPDLNSYTLEHVKPVSLYPDLAYDPMNCAASHFGCNSSAGNRAGTVTGTTSRRW